MGQYSHSRLQSFRQCPRKYYYKYIAKVKLPEEPEQIATFLGSQVHYGLEYLYQCARDGNSPEQDEVVECFEKVWSDRWQDNIVIQNSSLTPDNYREVGRRCITDYFERHYPFDQDRTVALEMRVNFPLDDTGEHTMIGYVDRLARLTDGTWQIHDYKTNSRLPTQQDMDVDQQLALYEIGLRQKWSDIENVKLIWHYVRFDTSIASTRTADQLETVRREILKTILEIERHPQGEDSFPTRESPLCAYCEFQSICPVRKHLAQVRDLPDNEFLGEPGVKLVDRWAELEEQKAEHNKEIDSLNEQMTRLQQALLTYAKQHGLDVVIGSDHQAIVRRSEKTLFPRKLREPQAAEELEKKLKASSWWPLVSTIDRAALVRLLDDADELDPQLIELLNDYAWIQDELVARLQKRRQ